MPEVGVLELQIRDNSSKAAEGLAELAGALFRVRSAIGAGLKLETTGHEVEEFVKKLTDSNKSLSGLSSFLKAVTQYSKAFEKLKDGTDKLKFNTQPIKDLKEALNGGIKIGQAGTQLLKLQEALGGKWNTDEAENIKTAMQAIAAGAQATADAKASSRINKMADALKAYASAMNEVKSAIGNGTSGGKSAEDLTPLTKKMLEEKKATGRSGMMKLNLQMFAEKRKTPAETGGTSSWRDQMSGVVDAARQVKETAQTIEQSKQSFTDLNELVEIFKRMKRTTTGGINLGRIATNLERIKEAASGVRLGAVANSIDTLYSKVMGASSSGLIETLNALADALRKLRDSAEGMQIGNINIKFGGGGKGGSGSGGGAASASDYVASVQQAAQSIEGTFQQVEGHVESVKQGIGDVTNAIIQINTVGSNAAEETERMARAFAELFRMATQMRSAFALPSGSDTGLARTDYVQAEGWVSGDSVPGLPPVGLPEGSREELEQTTEAIIVYKETCEEAKRATEGIEQTSSAFQEIKDNVNDANEALDTYDEHIEFARQWNASSGSSGVSATVKDDMEYINNLIDSASKIDLLNMKISALTDKLYEGVTSGKMTGDQIADLTMKIQRLKEEVSELESSTTGINGMFNRLKDGIQRMFPSLTQLAKRFQNLVKYRMLRSVIRHITSGFTEGVKNVYEYSKAVGTSFAPAMDAAATSLQQMKNSLGAAVAPVIQALIPVLQNVVSWFINLVNYANQFFALMTGQNSWTRALPESAEAFEKSSKAAKGTSKAIKDLLADWDELNIIQSESGGGGSSSSAKSAEEYKNMFEEVSEFSDGVKRAIDFIDEHLGGIPNLLKTAGMILLGWKFSKAFQGILGKLGKLLIGLESIKIGFELAYGAGFEAGQKGYFDTTDILTSIGGTIATALGGYLVGSAVAGPAGGAVGIVIGLGIGIMGTVYGWIEGQQDATDRARWGNLHRTQEEIEEFVKSQFTFDISSKIEIMDTLIENEDAARENLNEKIRNFNESLDTAKIMISAEITGEEKVKYVLEAARDASALIEAVNKLIDTHLETINFTVKEFTFTDEQGNSLNEKLKQVVSEASKDVEDYFTGIGKELAGYIKKGETIGLTEGEQEAALALLERERKILQTKDELSQQMNRKSEIMSGRVNVNLEDRDTAIAEIEREKELLEKYTKEAEETVRQSIYNLNDLAAYAEAEALDALAQGDEAAYQRLHGHSVDLKEQAEALSDPEAFKRAVDANLDESKRIMHNYWSELLTSVYSEDFSKMIQENTVAERKHLLGYMVDTRFNENLRYYSKKGDAGGFLERYFKSGLQEIDQSGVMSSVMETFGLSMWDLLNDEAKEAFFNNTATILGDEKQAAEAIMYAFGMEADVLEPYIARYVKDVKEQVNKELHGADTENTSIVNPLGWLANILGLAYTPPDQETINSITENVDKMVEEAVDQASTDVEMDIEIDPNIDAIKLYNEINKKILESGIEDQSIMLGQLVDLSNIGDIDAMKHLNQLIDTNGIIEAFDMLENYKNGFGWSLGKGVNPARLSARGMGMSDVGWVNNNGAFLNGSETVKTEPKDNQQEVSNVAAGVKSGNSELQQALTQLVNIVQAINRKEFSVNITPTAGWGLFNQRSNAEASMVTGDNP